MVGGWEAGGMTVEKVSDALVRRIEAAIADANVSRAAIEYDWPERSEERRVGKECPV